MESMFKGVSILEFQARFPDDKSCKDYLIALKWPKGYECRRCGNGKSCSTNRYGEHRCTKCRSVESATSNTLFHKVKFPLLKAFYIVFMISTNPKGCSSYELGRKLGLSQPVAWKFKRKAMEAMASSCEHPIDGEVHIDEAFIGGKQKGKPGRSISNKTQIVVAIQKYGNKGISRGYAQVIANAGTKELLPFIKKHVDKTAEIITDKWRGYTPISKAGDYNLIQKASGNGKNFDQLHRFIMMLKGWLRGIHHSVKHTQAYLNEYTYRFNRHKWKDTIFHNLISKMVKHEARTYNELKFAT